MVTAKWEPSNSAKLKIILNGDYCWNWVRPPCWFACKHTFNLLLSIKKLGVHWCENSVCVRDSANLNSHGLTCFKQICWCIIKPLSKGDVMMPSLAGDQVCPSGSRKGLQTLLYNPPRSCTPILLICQPASPPPCLIPQCRQRWKVKYHPHD